MYLTSQDEIEFITLDEFNTLMKSVDDIVYHSLFTFLFFMGTRIGEANALTWEDVDFEAKTIRINKTISTKLRDSNGDYLITTPKTQSSVRTLPMPQIVSNELFALHEYLSTAYGFSRSWFVFGGYTAIPESSIQKVKNRYFKEAGIKNIRIHDFRHSCASYLINNGASVLLVSKWLGHSNPNMTLKVYSHLWKSELYQLVDMIDSQTLEKCR